MQTLFLPHSYEEKEIPFYYYYFLIKQKGNIFSWGKGPILRQCFNSQKKQSINKSTTEITLSITNLATNLIWVTKFQAELQLGTQISHNSPEINNKTPKIQLNNTEQHKETHKISENQTWNEENQKRQRQIPRSHC